MSYLKMSFLLFFSLGILQSCVTKIPPTFPVVELQNSTWYFKSMRSAGGEVVEFTTAYELSFGDKEMRISLDKNNCHGAYRINGKQLVFDKGFLCTEICCDGEQAGLITGNLVNNMTIEKTEQTLSLVGDKHTFLLSNSKPTAKKGTLAGTSWKIGKVVSDAKEWTPKEAYNLHFTEKDMNVHFEKNGCHGSYKYNADQKQIIFEGVACTEICCDSKEADKLKFVFSSQVECSMEGETMVLSGKTQKLYLYPQKTEVATKTEVEAQSLWGTTWKVYDIVDKVGGIAMHSAEVIKVSFSNGNLSLKLDINSCNTTCEYVRNSININEMMGCTKMCCDSQISASTKTYFKGKFELSKTGEYLTLDNSVATIRLSKSE